MKIRSAALLLATSLVAACSDDVPPVVLNGAQANYFGSWEYVSNEYGNSIVSDNMLLVLHPDSTVSYKRCINRLNGHDYTSLGGAHINGLTDRQLVIRADVWFLHFTRELAINKPPHAEGDESYLEVDGLKLRKLKAGESSTHESWKCDSDEKKEGDAAETKL